MSAVIAVISLQLSASSSALWSDYDLSSDFVSRHMWTIW